MKSFFRTEPLEIEGEKLTIRELSAADHIAISGMKGSEAAEQVCKRCVVDWKDEELETIKENVPARVMGEIVAAVFKLSGLEVAKNSEPTPSAGSSTD